MPPTAPRSGDASQVEFVRGPVGRHARQFGQYRAQFLGSLPRLVSIAEHWCRRASCPGPWRPAALAACARREQADQCIGWARAAVSDSERKLYRQLAVFWLENAVRLEPRAIELPRDADAVALRLR